MNRQFPLAGLLRVRKVEHDAAVSQLGQTTARRQATTDQRMRMAGGLAASGTDAVDAASLTAIAAARAAAGSMLAALDAREQEQRLDEQRAAEAVRDAVRRTRGIEKLETRHHAAVVAEDLRLGQIEIDEIAGRRGGERS
ncbi:MAG: flagellar export protein FliJ [Microbacteriaceae bacterium]